MKFFPTLFLLLALAIPAAAQGTEDFVSADRPGMSTGTDIVPRHALQWETGLSFLRDDGLRSFNWNNSLLRFGLCPWMELRLEANLTQERQTRPAEIDIFGLEPLSLGTKIRIWEGDGPLPAIAVLCNAVLPVSSPAFRPDKPGASLTLLGEHNFTDAFCVGWNLGSIWDRIDTEPAGYAALCVSYGFTGRLGAFVESNNFFRKGDAPQYLVEGGVTFHPSPRVQLDVYGDLSASAFKSWYGVGAGITWLIF